MAQMPPLAQMGEKKKKQGKKGGRERSTLSVADTDEEFILWH